MSRKCESGCRCKRHLGRGRSEERRQQLKKLPQPRWQSVELNEVENLK